MSAITSVPKAAKPAAAPVPVAAKPIKAAGVAAVTHADAGARNIATPPGAPSRVPAPAPPAPAPRVPAANLLKAKVAPAAAPPAAAPTSPASSAPSAPSEPIRVKPTSTKPSAVPGARFLLAGSPTGAAGAPTKTTGRLPPGTHGFVDPGDGSGSASSNPLDPSDKIAKRFPGTQSDAASIDAAVPPAEAARLQQEQAALEQQAAAATPARQNEIYDAYYDEHDYYVADDGTVYAAEYSTSAEAVTLERGNVVSTTPEGYTVVNDTQIFLKNSGASDVTTSTHTTTPTGTNQLVTRASFDDAGDSTGTTIDETTTSHPGGTSTRGLPLGGTSSSHVVLDGDGNETRRTTRSRIEESTGLVESTIASETSWEDGQPVESSSETHIDTNEAIDGVTTTHAEDTTTETEYADGQPVLHTVITDNRDRVTQANGDYLENDESVALYYGDAQQDGTIIAGAPLTEDSVPQVQAVKQQTSFDADAGDDGLGVRTETSQIVTGTPEEPVYGYITIEVDEHRDGEDPAHAEYSQETDIDSGELVGDPEFVPNSLAEVAASLLGPAAAVATIAAFFPPFTPVAAPIAAGLNAANVAAQLQLINEDSAAASTTGLVLSVLGFAATSLKLAARGTAIPYGGGAIAPQPGLLGTSWATIAQANVPFLNAASVGVATAAVADQAVEGNGTTTRTVLSTIAQVLRTVAHAR